MIASRFKGAGCPVCSGLIPEVGVNDLATTHPELVKKWDYERNEKLKPEDLKAGSHKKSGGNAIRGIIFRPHLAGLFRQEK